MKILRGLKYGIATTGWVGTPDEIQRSAAAAEAGGTTELMFTPTGDFDARDAHLRRGDPRLSAARV